MSRVPPSEQTKKAIQQLLTEGGGEDPKSELIRLAMRRIMEEALEAAVRDLLGRGYYERSDSSDSGYRNGNRKRRLKSAEGEIEYSVPQVRGVPSDSLNELKAFFGGRSEELERLAIEAFARGCSTRDIEDTFTAPSGRKLLTRTAASELTEALWEEYEAFATRDLSDIKPLYLYLDGVAERLRAGSRRESVLAAWAITWEGKKLLLHMAPGTKESTDCCRAFLEDMLRRGLDAPVLVATDGAPGLIRAAEECFPWSLRQRCTVHKMRNIVSKLPDDYREAFKALVRAAYEAPSQEHARTIRDDLVRQYGKSCPTAVACFEEDFEACIAHLRCPPKHRRATRTTNLLERLFLEERRRMKAAITVFGEKPVLKMMFGALSRSTRRWAGVQITDLERAQLLRLRKELKEEFQERNAPVVKTKAKSSPKRFSSKNRT